MNQTEGTRNMILYYTGLFCMNTADDECDTVVTRDHIQIFYTKDDWILWGYDDLYKGITFGYW